MAGTGVAELKSQISQTIGAAACAESHATISERHRVLLAESLGQIQQASALLRSDAPDREPLAATSLRAALGAVGAITGKTYDEDLISGIFNSFCIGK
jgi:tRNA modification GTPase